MTLTAEGCVFLWGCLVTLGLEGSVLRWRLRMLRMKGLSFAPGHQHGYATPHPTQHIWFPSGARTGDSRFQEAADKTFQAGPSLLTQALRASGILRACRTPQVSFLPRDTGTPFFTLRCPFGVPLKQKHKNRRQIARTRPRIRTAPGGSVDRNARHPPGVSVASVHGARPGPRTHADLRRVNGHTN